MSFCIVSPRVLSYTPILRVPILITLAKLELFEPAVLLYSDHFHTKSCKTWDWLIRHGISISFCGRIKALIREVVIAGNRSSCIRFRGLKHNVDSTLGFRTGGIS